MLVSQTYVAAGKRTLASGGALTCVDSKINKNKSNICAIIVCTNKYTYGIVISTGGRRTCAERIDVRTVRQAFEVPPVNK